VPTNTLISGNTVKSGLAIFASGGGSNAQKIIDHFKDSTFASVKLIVTNNANAYVLERAKEGHIPSAIINTGQLKDKDHLLPLLEQHDISHIILAGFLQLIPAYLTKTYPNKIYNIHPALLPNYGGKGMYGHHVHQAVFDNNERESGITIHYVNENYDEGQVIFQDKVALDVMDTPDVIAKKVLELEHKHYARVIEEVVIG